MSKERDVLAQILKNWAQEHTTGYIISSPDQGDEGIMNTGAFFSWLIKKTDTNIDLLSLLNRLDFYFSSTKRKGDSDGMFCCKCQTYYQYAEPNQQDGSLLCYSCRNSPYS